MIKKDDRYSEGFMDGAREVIQMLKERLYLSSEWSHGAHPYVVEESDLDEVIEELESADD